MFITKKKYEELKSEIELLKQQVRQLRTNPLSIRFRSCDDKFYYYGALRSLIRAKRDKDNKDLSKALKKLTDEEKRILGLTNDK